MKVRTFRGRLVLGWLLVIAGALWCMEAAAVKAPAETGAVGSFMVIAGAMVVRSAVRARRRVRWERERVQIWQQGGYGTTPPPAPGRAAGRAAPSR